MYAVGIAILACVLIFTVGSEHSQQNPLIYIIITGSVGSLTVIGCKGLGIAIKETVNGNNQLTNWLTWIMVVSIVFNISVQINYLNKALDIFNTALVTPILYVVFTSCVILASTILFKEWKNLSAQDIIGNICGFCTLVTGIFLLQSFRELPESFGNFDNILKQNFKNASDESASCEKDLTDLHQQPELIRKHNGEPMMKSIAISSPQILTSDNNNKVLALPQLKKSHNRSHSYKLMDPMQSSHGSTVVITDCEPEMVTGYVNTGRHQRTSSSGSGKSMGIGTIRHNRSFSSGSNKTIALKKQTGKNVYN